MMDNKDLKVIAERLIATIENAGNKSIEIQNEGIKCNSKKDGSPVTNGDLASSYNLSVIPVTLYPCSFISPATTDESTPPDIATTTFVFLGNFFIPSELIITCYIL